LAGLALGGAGHRVDSFGWKTSRGALLERAVVVVMMCTGTNARDGVVGAWEDWGILGCCFRGTAVEAE